MKLKKPTFSKSAGDLQDYVSNLLFDETRKISNDQATNVTRLDRSAIASSLNHHSNLITRNSKSKAKRNIAEANPQEAFIRAIVPVKNGMISPSINALQPTTYVTKKIVNKSESSLLSSMETTNDIDLKRGNAASDEDDQKLKKVEQLLSKISLVNLHETMLEVNTPAKEDDNFENESDDRNLAQNDLDQTKANTAPTSFNVRQKYPLKEMLGNIFQTLIFEVNRLPLAVPLVKLGGIIDISAQSITPLVGTPNWFMGLVPNERGNLMVVDTQAFLMPEKKIVEERKYSYLIVLDNSQWALACHSVGDAKNLSPDNVRWSAGSSTRPWFAGMVVEFMSALLEVDELINLLAENLVSE